jgi:hypothetical protein
VVDRVRGVLCRVFSFLTEQRHRYRINGKSYTQEAKKSPFSLVQQQSGEFTITSVSQQQKLCKATVTDLRFNVHPLPSAQVGHGKRIYQDIHEGYSSLKYQLMMMC